MMRRVIVLLLLAMFWGATAVAPSPTHAQEKPTVQAVMFWMEGCGHCAWVKENALPPLAEQYGDQWQLELIELSSAEDFEHLFDLGSAIGVALLAAFAVRATRRAVTTGSEAMLAEYGEALAGFSGGRGQVRLHGEIWQARAERPVAAGTTVRVRERHGLTVAVEPVENGK